MESNYLGDRMEAMRDTDLSTQYAISLSMGLAGAISLIEGELTTIERKQILTELMLSHAAIVQMLQKKIEALDADA